MKLLNYFLDWWHGWREYVSMPDLDEFFYSSMDDARPVEPTFTYTSWDKSNENSDSDAPQWLVDEAAKDEYKSAVALGSEA